MGDTSEELHPLLIAELADGMQCEILREAAAQRSIVVVPLQAAPVDRRVHILEVYVPGATAPVSFMAEPTGPPDDDGFPLRLAPHGHATVPQSEEEDEDGPTIARPGAVVKAKSGQTSPSMSKSHTRDLDRAPIRVP